MSELGPHDTFQVIDLDRVLFDTGVFVDDLTSVINREHPGLGTELSKKMEAAYAREQTFFLLRFLRETRGDQWFEDVVAAIAAKNGPDHFLMPGARQRLAGADFITDLRPSFGVLTYGDTVDQLLKLKISQLEDVPLLITDTPHKAEVIESWQNPDGSFTLPEEFGGATVEHLTLEDDKLRAFSGLPENVTGLWITQQHDARTKLAKTGLQNVVIAPDAFASLAYLTGNSLR